MPKPKPTGIKDVEIADAVDVALDEMAPEGLTGTHRRFDVDAVVGLEAPKRRPCQCLRDGVEHEPLALDGRGSEAAAVDRHRVPHVRGRRRL